MCHIKQKSKNMQTFYYKFDDLNMRKSGIKLWKKKEDIYLPQIRTKQNFVLNQHLSQMQSPDFRNTNNFIALLLNNFVTKKGKTLLDFVYSLRGMVSVANNGVKPDWILSDCWTIMQAYWATPKAKKTSASACASRLSDRNGLGPHRHRAGSCSYHMCFESILAYF